ncbi:MAG: hypothetical protein Kow0059_08460 [Candidatus Sumerlaeia bacterium]
MTDPTSLSVVLLTRALPLHRSGGLEFHSAHLARGLAEAGVRVCVVTTADPNDPARCEGELAGRVPVHFLPGTPPGGYNLRAFGEFARAARFHAHGEGRVVIHAQGFAGFAVRAGHPRQRFVLTVHGTLWSETPLWPDCWRRLTWRGRAAALWAMKHRLAVAPLWQRMLRRADVVLVDSAFTRRELEREGSHRLSAKLVSVPLGVPRDAFPAVPRNEARAWLQARHWGGGAGSLAGGGPLLLTVGRLHRMKGLHVLLEALRGLEGRWTLIVVGDGPERERLQRWVQVALMQERVVFAGRVPESELPYYYAGADVLVNPELGQPAFGLVALEALLQGTPVLANRAGALPEVIGEGDGPAAGGGLVGEPSAAAWRTALDEWIGREKWKSFDPEALRRSALRRFSFEAMIRGTLEAYERAFTLKRESVPE